MLLDEGVVIRQVVLGEQVDDERGSCILGDGALGDVPWFVPEARPPLPWDDVVELPVGSAGEVRLGETVDLGFDGLDQREFL